jgi:phosphatidylglycerol:prolipoprotein diacylglycerol transferase
MFPTLSFGPITLSTYTVLIDLGLVGALAWLWFRAPAHEREPARWLDAGLFAAAGALLGGRLAFAFGNWAYFQNHVGEMFRLWEGGYAWPGAAVGGLIGLILFSWLTREPLLPILDELALPALILSALGWLGCAAAGCAAGLDVPPGALPFAVNWPDLYGIVLPRWPSQIIGLGLSLIAFGYLLSQGNRHWPRGFRFALSLTLIAVAGLAVSFVRGDDMPLVGSWRLDTAANAALTVLGLVALVVAWALEPGAAKQTELNREDAKDTKVS